MSLCSSQTQTHDCNTSPMRSKSQPESLPEIIVNDVAIEESALADELQYHKHHDFNQVVQKAGQALVIRELFLQKARQSSLSITKENEEDVIQKLINDNVTYVDPTEETCMRYFENNPSRFTSPALMEVNHILLAASKDDITGREVAKNNAIDIIQQLQKDPILFPTLAKQFSACPSKATAGSLGQISKGQTVPEFERQLNNLPKGLAKKPIESRYGFHVVYVAQKIEGKPLDFSMVESKVKRYLIERASRLALQKYIQRLVEVADIQGIQLRFDEENIHVS